ncbi:MAG: hypothetical protein ACE5I7_13440 [Candidatus Binatia bacterium]
MSHPKRADLAGLIDALLAHQVQFIVVGGAGAVLHGALTVTQDLDVVHCLTPENVQRLQSVLDRLDAYVREPGHRRVRPDAPLLRSGGQLNLITALGPLDLLGRLHDGRGYHELLPHTEVLGDGTHDVRVVDLPTLIEIKSAAGRAKDRLVLPLLLALLRERK